MRTSRHIVIILGAIVLTVGAAAGGQSQTQPDESETGANKTGKISGRVETQSGRPLKNALVMILAYGVNTSKTAVTDSEGKFEATELWPRAYLVSATLPGYVAVPRDPDANPIGYYRVGDSVNIQMIKGGVITGTVK